MQHQYSQLRAMLAITKASLIASLKSPQAIMFSLFFPVVLIIIFASLASNRSTRVKVAFEPGTDMSLDIVRDLSHHPLLNFVKEDSKELNDQLSKGNITALIAVDSASTASSVYNITLKTSTSASNDVPLLQTILRDFIHRQEKEAFPGRQSLAHVTTQVVSGPKYAMIDFFLPGMIGFSLIGTAIIGVAFTFFSFRENLVLKRLYSTPISRTHIILGETLSRVVFQLTTVILLIAFGYLVYDFTLSNGIITAFNMVLMSFMGLIVFMGFGFLISGLAKTNTVIPMYANLFMFPQFFLSGTFFPKSALPATVQPVISLLPLTAVNDAMRNISFEGAGLWSCWPQLLILAVWAVIVYSLAVRFFKWE